MIIDQDKYKKIAKEAIKFDPLAVADEAVEKGYLTKEQGEAVGLVMMHQRGDILRRCAEATNDTFYGIPYDVFKEILAAEDFVEVFKSEYESVDGNQREEFAIYWNNGVILSCESYHGTLNNAEMYFNWQTDAVEKLPGWVSGYWYVKGDDWSSRDVDFMKRSEEGKLIWIGYIDVRVQFRAKLDEFHRDGMFLTNWVKKPFVWLRTYADSKLDPRISSVGIRSKEEYEIERMVTERINKERFDALPDYVRTCMITWKNGE